VTGNNYNVSNPSFCLEPSTGHNFKAGNGECGGPAKRQVFGEKLLIPWLLHLPRVIFLFAVDVRNTSFSSSVLFMINCGWGKCFRLE
jgi:hypothetical protein